YILIIAFVSLALLNPSLEEKKIQKNETLRGVDIIFIVDVSLSMYAVDVYPNRLEKFKETILRILPELNGNRLGIITFAGAPFLYCPMTGDISAFADYVRGLETDMIPDTGTNMKLAFEKADKILNSNKIFKNKVVVFVSDGEDKNKSIPSISDTEFIVWGIGTEEGGNIFYKDESNNVSGYVTMNRKLSPFQGESNLVVSKLQESYLKKIAYKNNGKYFNISKNPSLADEILKIIDEMGKNTNKKLNNILKKDGYQYFLVIGLILLILEVMGFEIILKRKLGE
ncbi:MAG: VWA domain-containing protein, partial [Leptospiraceae bacterium]|nr:VWA domain-containing protein [Leptospiraceae bacterium]